MAFTLELEQLRFSAFFGSTDVSGAAFTLLREAVAGLDFGAGLQSVKVVVYLRHKGKPPRAFTAQDVAKYHAYLALLPKITLRKKNAAATVLWHANIDPGPMLVEGNEVSYASFEILAGEVIQALEALRPRLARVKNFDLDKLLGKLVETVATTPKSDRGFREAVRKGLAACEERWKRDTAAKDPWAMLDIDWKQFHPRARALLDDPFFWDPADDLAPLGNDTGADVFERYRGSRRRKTTGRSALTMLQRLLREWGTPVQGGSAAQRLVRDEATIALAFSQIMLDGKPEQDVAKLAHEAIDRQLTTAGEWRDPKERANRLRQLEKALRGSQ